MREHEVPTHVQAEDRVLLGLTFPQVVAITAVCAISYGTYRYVPVGPSEVRMALAVLLGLAGIAAVVGKIGGRRLPLVAADLLKYRLGAQVHAGTVSQLVRSEPPAPVQPVKSGPGPLSLMARRSKRALRSLRKKKNRRKERRNGRMPFRPHGWFGKRRRKGGGEHQGQRPKSWIAVVAAVALAAAVATAPQAVLADDHWRDEIDFELTEPVPGRRIFVEGLTVSGDRAAVTLRAATALDIRVRAFGGPDGDWLRFWGSARLAEGESIDYSLPLHGPKPSFTFSWEDGIGQAGAVTVKEAQLPFPLPVVEGELCVVRVVSLGWTPGEVSGVIESECVALVEEPVELQTVVGHVEVTETTLMDAEVTAVTGTVSAASGASHVSVPFVPDDVTRFSLSVGEGEAIHGVTVDVEMEASLRIPVPPLTQLTHHPERTEYRTETVSLLQAGNDQDRQQDGHGNPRRRNDDGARRHSNPVDTQQDGPPGRDPHHRPPGARRVRDGGARAHRQVQGRESLPGIRSRGRRPVRGPGTAGAGARGAARRSDPRGRRPKRMVPNPWMGVALVRRALVITLLAGVALATTGAAPAEERAMLEAFDRVLTAMAYAGSGLCLFAIVWAGFLLMAEGGEERGGGRARTAVVMAVVGLVLVLSAKGVAALLSSGVVPSFPSP